MSIFSRLKFWKRDEDEFLNEGAGTVTGTKDELGLPEMQDQNEQPGMPKTEEPDTAPPPHLRDYQPTTQPLPYAQPQMQQPMMPQHRLEIIDSKLDAIKAILSALEQRLDNIQRTSKNEKKYW